MNLSVFSVEFKVGTPIGYSIGYLYSLGGAESKEGGGIAQAWVADPKVYPGMSMLQRGVQTGWDSGGYRRPKNTNNNLRNYQIYIKMQTKIVTNLTLWLW